MQIGSISGGAETRGRGRTSTDIRLFAPRGVMTAHPLLACDSDGCDMVDGAEDTEGAQDTEGAEDVAVGHVRSMSTISGAGSVAAPATCAWIRS